MKATKWFWPALIAAAGVLFSQPAETFGNPMGKARQQAKLTKQNSFLKPVQSVPMCSIDHMVRKSRKVDAQPAKFLQAEGEPNDNINQANPVDLSSGSADVTGTLTPAALSLRNITTSEENGSIGTATNTGVIGGSSDGVTVDSIIGDGSFGGSTGDFDLYAVTLQEGQLVSAETFTPGSSLDTIIDVYDSTGDLIAFNDDFNGLDSFVLFAAPFDDTFYFSVTGFPSFQTNPFDPGSGDGAGSSGSYTLEIKVDFADSDFFSFDLAVGDIISVDADETPFMNLYRPDGTLMVGTSFNANSVLAESSPIPSGLGTSVCYVIDEAGAYSLELLGDIGSYESRLRVLRPDILDEPEGAVQTIFVDFDGATFDAGAAFGSPNGTITASPLSAFLPNWGLTASDEDAVIDAIMAEVELTLRQDVADLGSNGFFTETGIGGDFDIQLLNSRDHADPFGLPNVSRVIVGGTIDELGIPTIGIAESIDIGNFAREETAIVLLDLLSGTPADAGFSSLNSYSIDESASIIDLIGIGVGRIVTHEAGHFLGNFHSFNFSDTPSIMDSGGNLPELIGIGSDNTFGTGDDFRVRFDRDTFSPSEFFTGITNPADTVAHGASTSLESTLLSADEWQLY